MFARIANRIVVLVASLNALAFIGCLATPMEPEVDPAQVVIETRVPASPVALDRLVLTFASDRGDTLHDTITQDGSRLSRRFAALDARAGRTQSVVAEYALAPDRRWSLNARLLDARDSVRMRDSAALGSLKAFERREAVLAPEQRFAACPARFVLPAAYGARRLEFTRLQLLVDGAVTRDTLAPQGEAFAAGAARAVTLADEYLEQGRHQVTFKAFGRVEGDARPRLLFEGGRAVEAVAGQMASTSDVVLAWQAKDVAGPARPDADEAADAGADEIGLKVTIGKVGTVALVAQMSGAIDL